MLKKVLNFIFILGLWMSSWRPSSTPGELSAFRQQGTARTVIKSLGEQGPGIHILSANEQGLVLRLVAPAFTIDRISLAEQGFDVISAPGTGITGEPGEPGVPTFGILIGAPPGAAVDIDVLPAQPILAADQIHLAPAPQAEAASEDFQPGGWLYRENQEAYAHSGWWPDVPAYLAEDAWLRDQRILRLEWSPFQFDPTQDRLRWYPELQVTVRFTESPGFVHRTRPSTAAIELNPFETALQETLVNYAIARDWRAWPMDSTALGMALVPGKDYLKIVVDEDGVYRIGFDELQASGLDLTLLNPLYFQLENLGSAVAYELEDDGDGIFELGEALIFYGEKFRGDRLAAIYQDTMQNWLRLCSSCQLQGVFEKYTEDNVYWLSISDQPGIQMVKQDAAPQDQYPVPDAYTATVRAEPSHYWFSYHFTNEDTWFWDRINTGIPVTRSYTLTLDAIAPGVEPVTLRTSLVSRMETTGHHTVFYWNDLVQPVEDAIWNGKTRHTIETSVPVSSLKEGVNTLRMNLIPGASSESIYYDWLEIIYQRKFQAKADQLSFSWDQPGSWQFRVGDIASAQTRIYQVSDSLRPQRWLNPRQIPTEGGVRVEFQVVNDAPAQFWVCGENSIRSPQQITLVQPVDWSMPESGLDYIFITHADFFTTTQRLADYRKEHGLRTRVVDVQDLYDQFNYGIYHPVAVRNFLTYAFQNWQAPPQYAVLVGDGHFNIQFKSNIYAFTPLYMPPNLAFVDPWQGETDSVNLLAAVVGDDILPDVAIGRIPVNTSAELNGIIDKIQTYEAQPFEDWQRNMLFVADNADAAGDFQASAENMISDFLPGYFTPLRVYCTAASCNTASTQIKDAMTGEGALILQYFGHGSINAWAGTPVMFRNVDAEVLTNTHQLPLVLSWTCLDGFWQHPDQNSTEEVMLRNPDGGSIGAFSPTGLGVASGHDAMAAGFLRSLFRDGRWDLASATEAARLALYQTGYNFDLISTYTILGDPALKIRSPYALDVEAPKRQKYGMPGENLAYTLSITNTGIVTDTFSINITGSQWVTTAITQTAALAPGASEAFIVTVQVPDSLLSVLSDYSHVLVESRGDRAQKREVILNSWTGETTFLPIIQR